jgi:hypothetical protein
VIENIGACRKDALERLVLTIEIRHQNFDHDLRIEVTNGFDGFSEMVGTAISKVITRHGSNDDMFQTQAFHALGNTLGLILLKGEGLGCIHRAKPHARAAAVLCQRS